MKKYLLVIIGIIVFYFILVIGLRKAQYVPQGVINTAQNFATLILNGEREKAYELTDKKTGVGINFKQFNDKVDKNIGKKAEENTEKTFKIIKVIPFQSYANWLYHLLIKRNMKVYHYSIDSNFNGIPFEIRVKPINNNNWKVFYFQSHAG